MDTHIKKAIEILGKADRDRLSVPERRLYDAAMESYRYLPQAELLHDIEDVADRINFRNLMDRCGEDYIDFMESVGKADRRAHMDVQKWMDAGWDAELVREERGRVTSGGTMPVYLVRVKRRASAGKEGE